MVDKLSINATSTSQELKKCPFCGGEARLQTKARKRGYYVICKKCGCRTPFFQYQFDSTEKLQEEAIKAWNSRKPVEDVLEKLRELKMAEYDDSDEEPEFTDVEEWFDEGESSGRFEAYGKAIEIIKEELGGVINV